MISGEGIVGFFYGGQYIWQGVDERDHLQLFSTFPSYFRLGTHGTGKTRPYLVQFFLFYIYEHRIGPTKGDDWESDHSSLTHT